MSIEADRLAESDESDSRHVATNAESMLRVSLAELSLACVAIVHSSYFPGGMCVLDGLHISDSVSLTPSVKTILTSLVLIVCKHYSATVAPMYLRPSAGYVRP